MLSGVAAASHLVLESPGRRDEIFLYILPRTFEVIWGFLLKRKYVKNLAAGEVDLTHLSALHYSSQSRIYCLHSLWQL